MKLADVIGALRRRWYVLLAGVLVAAGVSSFLWSTVPPEYERTGTQLLLPGLATIPEHANPYLFVGGLYQIADVVVRAIGPDDIAEATRDYPGADVVVGRDQAAGAVLVVTVTASSDADAGAVLDTMLGITGRTLDELQNEQRIPADERVVITPLTAADESTVIQKTRLTVTALAGAAVLLLALGIAVVLDGIVRARRRARAGAIPREQDAAGGGRAGDDATRDDTTGGDTTGEAAVGAASVGVVRRPLATIDPVEPVSSRSEQLRDDAEPPAGADHAEAEGESAGEPSPTGAVADADAGDESAAADGGGGERDAEPGADTDTDAEPEPGADALPPVAAASAGGPRGADARPARNGRTGGSAARARSLVGKRPTR
ncbi:hypothetical protein [Microbacterium sp. cx-59]|uniref:hypothetical protein n=1 Tax=Microbacterium sp. cx-59 TaxID=2891207 RepID=UPI001E5753A5|nr:hypothetical protein [Microbacterium sp. cx-59]MCC4908025.1 hypothetical protein [Microbacterium sp. cx-59]